MTSDKLSRAIQILKNLNQPDRVVKRNSINFRKLMSILGNPYNSFKSIHITGTNGKGSVALKTAQILQRAGYRTGIYTSPHLFTFRERITVNGQMITQQDISNNIIKVQQISKQHNLPLSYFEYITASGFLYFQQKQCDYVALQVGLGGNNDTTNVVNPEVSVITSIGLDHTDLLGPTKEHIAREKSGIIKAGRPVVLGPNSQGYQSIQQKIKDLSCTAFRVQESAYDHSDFESQNNSITKQVIKALKYSNPELKINQENIEQGLRARQPCRMQVLKDQFLPEHAKGKKIYFDVGHNPPAIKKVKQFIKNHGWKRQQVSILFGTSKKKNYGEALAELEQISSHIYLIEAKHFRACPIKQLQSYIGMSKYPNKYRCFSDGDIASTLKYATIDPQCKALIICGSFFIMPEARGYFQPKLIQNPDENLNQIYQLQNKSQK